MPKGEMPEGLTFENEMDYTTLETALRLYVNDYEESGYTDTWYEGCGLEQDKYINLKQDMLKSVYINGGFYIGRYETGIKEDVFRNHGSDITIEYPTNEEPVIQQDKYVYNWVMCSQAQKLSENLTVGEKTSSLMFGLQWDLTLKYLETSDGSSTDLIENSGLWGNYSGVTFEIKRGKYSTNYGNSYTSVNDTYEKPASSVLLTTGATERNSKMNIYDLAGNINEWTLEKSNDISTPCTLRGGHYNGNEQVTHRACTNISNYFRSGGFCVTLY